MFHCPLTNSSSLKITAAYCPFSPSPNVALSTFLLLATPSALPNLPLCQAEGQSNILGTGEKEEGLGPKIA
jgi:hypothetical protein